MVHVIKRGARGMEIVRDTSDRERFLDSLFVLNDEYKNDNWVRDIESYPRFTRPKYWPEQKPLVDIHAFTLLDNHLHLLIGLRNDSTAGLVDFTRRLFRSMTGYFNEKHHEKGSIFQGPYKSVEVTADSQLRYLIPYILVKNTLEMHPSGLAVAHDFDSAWQWACAYRYSSLGHASGATDSPILTKDNVVTDVFRTESELRAASRDMLSSYLEKRTDFKSLQLEE